MDSEVSRYPKSTGKRPKFDDSYLGFFVTEDGSLHIMGSDYYAAQRVFLCMNLAFYWEETSSTRVKQALVEWGTKIISNKYVWGTFFKSNSAIARQLAFALSSTGFYRRWYPASNMTRTDIDSVTPQLDQVYYDLVKLEYLAQKVELQEHFPVCAKMLDDLISAPFTREWQVVCSRLTSMDALSGYGRLRS